MQKAQKELNSLFDDDSEPESPRNPSNLDVVPEKLAPTEATNNNISSINNSDINNTVFSEKMNVF